MQLSTSLQPVSVQLPPHHYTSEHCQTLLTCLVAVRTQSANQDMNARGLDITDSGPASHHDSVGHPKTAGLDTTAIGLELVSGWELTGNKNTYMR